MTAPRVTIDEIEDYVASEHYFTAAQGVYGAAGTPGIVAGAPIDSPLDLLTFCVLVLKNGYTVVGKGACVSAENFNAKLGREIARKDAIGNCWPLFGYALADSIYREREKRPGAQ